MQLFRQQAIEHRNRLHGEVFLVQAPRWEPIGWLLLALACAAMLFLTFGSYGRALSANGFLRPPATSTDPRSSDWRLELHVTPSIASQLAPGQLAEVTLPDQPGSATPVLRAVVDHVGTTRATGPKPDVTITARLDPPSESQRRQGIVLRPDMAANARITLGRRTFLQWLRDRAAAVPAQ